MKPKKRTRCSEHYDRLSEMPDEIIVHILSYLPTLDAVQTMLIRPFGDLWTLLPTLYFDLDEFCFKMGNGGSNRFKRFIIFVGNVIMRHKRPVIDEFHLLLRGYYYEDDGREEVGDDIRMWLKFALDKQAKDIYFQDVSSCDISYDSSDFPNFISQSFVTLELSDCGILPQLQVDLGSLKKLKFYYVGMSEEDFQLFICGCPSLQELHIDNPFGISNLSFSAPNIRKLFLCLESYDPDDDTWLLDFPNLKSLHLKLNQIPHIVRIGDVSSVQDVYLEWSLFDMVDEDQLRRMVKLFLENFSESQVFCLSKYASEQFLHSIDDLHPLQIKWKHVVLKLQIFCQTCLFAFNELMRSLKDLEEIDIYIDTTSTYISLCNTPNVFPGQALKASADLAKLKIVTFHGYAKPWKYQLGLVEFFLKSATTLEKLVIVPNKPHLTVAEMKKFVRKVWSFQRASPPHLTVAEKQEFVTEVSSFERASPNAKVLFL